MPKRAMNNTEKANAKVLTELGFHVFWFNSGKDTGYYCATHPKLTYQYCLNTTFNQAIEHLKEINHKH